MSAAFEMRGISKSFPGVRALDGVSLRAEAGEVHALVGENGAGKSTLMRVLTGAHPPDAGTMAVGGRPFAPRHPLDAARAGIAVVTQELALLPDRTVAQNVFLGREPGGWRIDRRAMREGARAALAVFGEGHGIEPDAFVRDLPVARRQMVEIARALSRSPRVLVLDEPTAALDERECERLFLAVERLRGEGVAVVYITHRMAEIQRLADRVMVLKDGRVSAAWDRVPAPGEIVAAMVGRELGAYFPRRAEGAGEVVLSVRGGSNAALRDVSFELRAGEVVGLAGLQGSGRAALARALFGVEPFERGAMALGGRPFAPRSPREAAAAGLAMLPGDRKAEGLLLAQGVGDNGLVSARAFARLLGRPDRAPRADRARIEALFRELDLRAADLDAPVATLSGGNQQKVIVARWLAMGPRALVFVEPTKGIDVSAKAGLHAIMRDLARAGAGVLFASSDLPEVVGVADRVLVMREGRLAGELPGGATEAEVMAVATGVVPGLGRAA